MGWPTDKKGGGDEAACKEEPGGHGQHLIIEEMEQSMTRNPLGSRGAIIMMCPEEQQRLSVVMSCSSGQQVAMRCPQEQQWDAGGNMLTSGAAAGTGLDKMLSMAVVGAL